MHSLRHRSRCGNQRQKLSLHLLLHYLVNLGLVVVSDVLHDLCFEN